MTTWLILAFAFIVGGVVVHLAGRARQDAGEPESQTPESDDVMGDVPGSAPGWGAEKVRRGWRPREWKPAFELLRQADDPPPVEILELAASGKINYLGHNRGYLVLNVHFMRGREASSVNFDALSHVNGWDDEWKLRGTATRSRRGHRHVAPGVIATAARTRERADSPVDVSFERLELGYDATHCVVEGIIEAGRYDRDWADNRSDYKFAGVLQVNRLQPAKQKR